MSIGIQTDAKLIKPLEGAIVRRYTAGAAIAAGTPVTMSADEAIDESDASDATLSFCHGVSVQAAAAAGVRIDVVVFGPISSITGGTAGVLVYVSDTVGEVSETAGTKTTIVGWNESATVLFVNPKVVSLS